METLMIRSCVILMMTPWSWAQTAPAGGDQKAFEVVSIKRSASDARQQNNVFPGGRFTATGVTLKSLIMRAYNVGPFLLSGANGWMESERYDIAAKAPDGSMRGPVGRAAGVAGPGGDRSNWTAMDPNSEASKQFRAMMQAMLVERFQLKLHRETRELPVYALLQAKGDAKDGAKLRPAKSESLQMKWGTGQVSYEGAPLSMLATTLTQLTGRLVLDQTGLKNNYDFTLQWTPDEGQMQMFRRAGDSGNNGAAEAEASGPSVFTALKEQLGLKLEPTKAPVEILVVDSATRPSEN